MSEFEKEKKRVCKDLNKAKGDERVYLRGKLACLAKLRKIFTQQQRIITTKDSEIDRLNKRIDELTSQLEEIRFYIPHIDKNVDDSQKVIKKLRECLDSIKDRCIKMGGDYHQLEHISFAEDKHTEAKRLQGIRTTYFAVADFVETCLKELDKA